MLDMVFRHWTRSGPVAASVRALRDELDSSGAGLGFAAAPQASGSPGKGLLLPLTSSEAWRGPTSPVAQRGLPALLTAPSPGEAAGLVVGLWWAWAGFCPFLVQPWLQTQGLWGLSQCPCPFLLQQRLTLFCPGAGSPAQEGFLPCPEGHRGFAFTFPEKQGISACNLVLGRCSPLPPEAGEASASSLETWGFVGLWEQEQSCPPCSGFRALGSD